MFIRQGYLVLGFLHILPESPELELARTAERHCTNNQKYGELNNLNSQQPPCKFWIFLIRYCSTQPATMEKINVHCSVHFNRGGEVVL